MKPIHFIPTKTQTNKYSYNVISNSIYIVRIIKMVDLFMYIVLQSLQTIQVYLISKITLVKFNADSFLGVQYRQFSKRVWSECGTLVPCEYYCLSLNTQTF